MPIRVALLVGFWGILSTSFGQVSDFKQVSTTQGLSQSNVTSLAQDSIGYMWIGTDDGLNRYDGLNFKTYSYNSNDPHTISTSAIRSLCVARNGTIWIGTNSGGLCRYLPSLDGFERIESIKNSNTPFSSCTILSIAEDILGNIWVGTEKNGIFRITITDDIQFSLLNLRANSDNLNSIRNNYVHSICTTSDGNIIFGTYGGLSILSSAQVNAQSEENLQFQNIHVKTNDSCHLSGDAIRSILEDSNGDFWIGTWGAGLNKISFSENGCDIIQYRINDTLGNGTNNPYISTIYETKKDNIWVGTFENGLNIYNSNTKKFNYYTSERGAQNYINSNFISAICQDASGVTWVGTYGAGLSRYSKSKNPFQTYRQSGKNPKGLSNNLVFAILQDKNKNLWVGTHGGGLNLIRNPDLKEGQREIDVFDKKHIASNVVLSIEEAEKGNIWIGTREGISIYNPKQESFQTISSDLSNSNGLWGRYIWTILNDHQGSLWIGTRKGLNEWVTTDEIFRHYVHDENNQNSISNNNVNCVFKDCKIQLWVGTAMGLNLKRTKESVNFERLYSTSLVQNGLIGAKINCLAEDQEGRIWVGTSIGLSCILNPYDDVTGSEFIIRNFNVEDGFSNDVIYGILVDISGDIWVSTNKGLSQFSPDQLLNSSNSPSVIKNYSQIDGLQSNEFNLGAYYKDSKGALYFGGNNGLNKFTPSEIQTNLFVPPIVITSIKLGNKSIPVPVNKKLNLSWKDYALTIEYAALNSIHPEKNNFSYQLKGVDPHKIYAGNRRRVDYTNLAPGNYEFNLTGSNNDGVWNESGTSLTIAVSSPPWQTWWAYSLYIFLGIWGIRSYLRARTIKARRRAKLQEEIQKAKHEERMRVRKNSSRDFHDELGNRITKVALLLGLLKSKTKNAASIKIIDKVEENNQMLSSGLRDFIWILDTNNESIRDTLNRIIDFGNSLFEYSNVIFESSIIDHPLLEQTLTMEKRRHSVLLFKEAMNNALKYASADTVNFSAGIINKKVIMKLSDNGNGFESDFMITGYGMENMKKRAKQMGTVLEVESELNVGTIISICFIS